MPTEPLPLRPPPPDPASRGGTLLVAPTPARGGWHWKEWGCELVGTALLLLGGLSAICLDFGTHSPVAQLIPSSSTRLLLTGVLFAGTGSLVALTPLGRLSGAHLNPVVTLAFWTQRKVHPHDLVGYVVGQLLGGLLGAALVLLLWADVARSVRVGATAPGPGVSMLAATALEAAMTAVLILTILLMTSSVRTARWTPLVLWPLITVLVWQGAPYTGTSLNPARSLGPALLAPLLGPLPIYVLGPLAGGAVAVGVFALLRNRRTVTAKLFHDPRYPGTLGHSFDGDHVVQQP
ncbi:MAG: aquaporin [Dermatophilaceae bacterium]